MESGIFKFYKNRLIKECGELCEGNIRFNVIQYLCSFPGLDPVEMAASLIWDGYQVLFDDSSISKKENARNRHLVERLVKARKAEQTE